MGLGVRWSQTVVTLGVYAAWCLIGCTEGPWRQFAGSYSSLWSQCCPSLGSRQVRWGTFGKPRGLGFTLARLSCPSAPSCRIRNYVYWLRLYIETSSSSMASRISASQKSEASLSLMQTNMKTWSLEAAFLFPFGLVRSASMILPHVENRANSRQVA